MKDLAAIALVLAALVLCGCNTVHGFGKDIEAIGGGVSGGAAH